METGSSDKNRSRIGKEPWCSYRLTDDLNLIMGGVVNADNAQKEKRKGVKGTHIQKPEESRKRERGKRERKGNP